MAEETAIPSFDTVAKIGENFINQAIAEVFGDPFAEHSRNFLSSLLFMYNDLAPVGSKLEDLIKYRRCVTSGRKDCIDVSYKMYE
jgi:hypothetical protein